MPAPMMMASKSEIASLPRLWFAPRLSGLVAADKPCMGAWQGCRFAVSRSRSALLTTASTPIVGIRSAHQAATEKGEGSNGPGAAAQADVDGRQRPPSLSGRHLAAAVRTTASGRSGALLRATPFGPYWSVTRHADIMEVELDHEIYSSARRRAVSRSATSRKGVRSDNFIRDGRAAPHRPAQDRRAHRGAVAISPSSNR